MFAAGRWEMQYFHDKEKSTLSLNDIKFPSARRGVAAGVIQEGTRRRPVTLLTSDGGAHWTEQPAAEEGISLFFLNENSGWMVTPKGIWSTSEAGRNWRKLSRSPKNLLTVYFLTEQRGFAVGLRRTAWETNDGGQSWKPLVEAEKKGEGAGQAAYNSIHFLNGQMGMISGWTMKAYEAERLPAWIEPDHAIRRAERPVTWLSLLTADGGKTWRPSHRSNYGRVARVRMGPALRGLMLVELGDGFDFPSTLIRVDYEKLSSVRVFAEKRTYLTDIAISPAGRAYAVGSQPAGELRTAPVPGKLQILSSDGPDYANWTPMEADYRAVATRAAIAVVDDRNMWVATDTGMILKLVP
jgi:hypothetical protein